MLRVCFCSLKLFGVNFFKQKHVIFLICLSFFSFYFLLFINSPANSNSIQKLVPVNDSIRKDGKLFSPSLSAQRINRLFSILHKKEIKYSNIFSKLNVISFQDLIDQNLTNNNEAFTYFEINSSNGSQLQVKQNFVQYLFDLSNRYSFQRNS